MQGENMMHNPIDFTEFDSAIVLGDLICFLMCTDCVSQEACAEAAELAVMQ